MVVDFSNDQNDQLVFGLLNKDSSLFSKNALPPR